MTTSAAPPTEPGYFYVRDLPLTIFAANTSTGDTSVLSLWYSDAEDDYFTLASNVSYAEAIAKGYHHLADLGRVANQPYQANLGDADAIIVCVSTPSSEGHDRSNLSLTTADNQLIFDLSSKYTNIIVVLHVPGAVLMPWVSQVSDLVDSSGS